MLIQIKEAAAVSWLTSHDGTTHSMEVWPEEPQGTWTRSWVCVVNDLDEYKFADRCVVVLAKGTRRNASHPRILLSRDSDLQTHLRSATGEGPQTRSR
jgi:hypothetical protein